MHEAKLEETKQKYFKQIEELNSQLDYQKRSRQQAEKIRSSGEQERNELASELQSTQSLRIDADRRRKAAEQQANDMKSQLSESENQRNIISAQLSKVINPP